MFSTKMLVFIVVLAFIGHQTVLAQLDLTSILTGILNGVLGGVTGGGNIATQLANLVNSLVNQLTGGNGQSGGCGILARLIGGCGGAQPCCGCCNRTSSGVNDVCLTVGLLDFLVGTAECPTGSILVCTGQACQVGDTCNAANIANLACVNV